MDRTDCNQDKSTTDHRSFGQPSCEEANQLATPKRAGSNAHFDMESNSPDGGSRQWKSVDNSDDCNNNVSLDDNANSPVSRNSHNHARARSNDRDKQPWVGERFPMLLRAPAKRHAVNRNMDGMNKIRRRPRCGRNLFGIDQDAMVDADGNEILYQVKRNVSIAPVIDQFQSPKPSEDDNFSFTDVEMSVTPLVCVPLHYMNVSSQCNSPNNSDVDNCHSTADKSNNGSQTEDNNAGKDCKNVNDRLVETSTHLTSGDGYLRSHAAGTPSNSPVSTDDNGNPTGFAEGDSDAEYDRPRLLPEHYVAPRRQRRLSLSIRARLAPMRGRRLSFNSYDDESNNEEAIPEDANRQLSHESSSLHAFSHSSERRLSNQNARKRLFDSDNNSSEKSFYMITQSHNNSRLSNHIDVATIQSILDTVFGSACSDNSCPKQSRPHNKSFSDDSDDLDSSDEDCNDDNGSSDSSDLSSEEEYVGSTVESVYFLPKSQLSVFDSDLHSSSLCPVANEDNDNLGYCAVESSDTDDDNSTLDNRADEDCNIVNDSEEETFTFLTSSEDFSRSPVAGTPPFSPATNDNRGNLRAEEDSDAEYNRQRCRPEQCAAPRRQRRLPASRRSRPLPLSRRRLCFDDSDDESNSQRAMSADTSVVSQSDCSIRSRLFSPDNKSLYVLAPSHNQPRHSSQVDIASILSILNGFFNPPSCDNRSSSQYSPLSCDNRSSSQYNPSNNSPSEHEPDHCVDQPSLATDSSRPSNNHSHNVSEDPEQTESPSHPPSPDNSDDPLE